MHRLSSQKNNNGPKHDFREEANKMLRIIESRICSGHRKSALEFLILKFKALYEEGVRSGRHYEKDGIYPFNYMEHNDPHDHNTG
jgi:hypothetical protein